MEKAAMYHIHIYFDGATESIARRIYRAAEGQALVTVLGRFHPKPIGPHPCRQFQMKVDTQNVDALIAWTDGRRDGLSVLIHPEIDNDYLAHTQLARWLGSPRELKLDGLTGGPR
jgi:aromatic ring-cleaving dioxygenase